MTEIGETLRAAASALTPASATPRLDAELLMAHALGIERSALLLDPVRYAVPDSFAAMLARRATHEPIAYIIGYRDFWTVRIAVGAGVLVPRADSETLLEAAIAHFGNAPPRHILDLGTGPGTLLLAALTEWPLASGLGIDAAPVALDYARHNATALGLESRARFQSGDWGAGLTERFDLVLCNPPYIGTGEMLMAEVAAHEPSSALFAGSDGLDDYRRILPELPGLLAPGAIAILEIGWQQAAEVVALAAEAGLAGAVHRDLGGRDRALLLRAKPSQ